MCYKGDFMRLGPDFGRFGHAKVHVSCSGP